MVIVEARSSAVVGRRAVGIANTLFVAACKIPGQGKMAQPDSTLRYDG